MSHTTTNQSVSSYEQQAIDFLQSTNCEFSVTYLNNAKYFPTDKEERDIYMVSLKRGSRTFSFTFGQSINNSGFYATMGKRKIDIDRKYLSKTKMEVRMHVKMNTSWDFGTVKADDLHYPIAPNAYDVLASLTKYDPGTFENFCSEFGYDTDSRTAETTYKAVVNEYQQLCTLFTDAELELMQEIQ